MCNVITVMNSILNISLVKSLFNRSLISSVNVEVRVCGFMGLLRTWILILTRMNETFYHFSFGWSVYISSSQPAAPRIGILSAYLTISFNMAENINDIRQKNNDVMAFYDELRVWFIPFSHLGGL